MLGEHTQTHQRETQKKNVFKLQIKLRQIWKLSSLDLSKSFNTQIMMKQTEELLYMILGKKNLLQLFLMLMLSSNARMFFKLTYGLRFKIICTAVLRFPCQGPGINISGLQ